MTRTDLMWLLPALLLAGCGAGDTEATGDDASLGYDRVVLCELFVGLACANCPEAEAALDQLLEEMPAGRLVAVHWHTGTVYPDVEATEFGRSRMSGFTSHFGGPGGVPTCYVNGLRRITGAITQETAYAAYKDAYQRESEIRSPLKITVTPEADSLEVRAAIQIASSADADLVDVDLIAVLLEHEALNANPRFGPERWSYLARAAEQRVITLTAGEAGLHDVALPLLEAWDRERFLLVVLVQEADYGEVLQAVMVHV